MKTIRNTALTLVLLGLICLSCNENKPVSNAVDYADTTYWYSYGDQSHGADVFYIYPTVAMISYEENGNSWFVDITQAEAREEANENQLFNKLLYSDYNFYAPYYRQMIFGAYLQPMDSLNHYAEIAAVDVIDAFQYYMEHFNNGRPFFLMGHSQGSQLLIELLKHGMTEEQRQQMVAAYCIGYFITEEDLVRYPEALKPAVDSVSQGVVIFNSMTDVKAAVPLFEEGVVGINPLTWTDDTLQVDKSMHLGMAKVNDDWDSIIFVPHVTGGHLENHNMICTDVDPGMVYIESLKDAFPYGNLHIADSWLFGGNVVENMRCRLRHYKN